MKIHNNKKGTIKAGQMKPMQIGRIIGGAYDGDLVMMGKEIIFCLSDGDYWPDNGKYFDVEILPEGTLLEI